MATRIACDQLASQADVELIGNCKVDIVPTADIDAALDAASDVLARLAVGWTLGRCTVNLRPCRESCIGHPCGCCTLRGIKLDGIDPVVTEVRISGEIVESDTYAVITRPNGDKWLERFHSDGRPAYWPGCQRVALAPTEEDTFQVSYTHGLANDMLMRWAAAEIAVDILSPFLAQQNSLEDLPDGTASVDAYQMRLTTVREVVGSEATDTDRLAGLGHVKRFLAAYPPQKSMCSIWAPELTDGYAHYARG